MLLMSVTGTIYKHPEYKISQRGTPFVKICVDVPPQKEGAYSTRVWLTGFGDNVDRLQHLSEGTTISLTATPDVYAYTNKQGHVKGILQGVIREVKSLSQAKNPEQHVQRTAAPQQIQSVQPTPEPLFDDDIPF
jgi:hypothetical protein